MRDRGRQAGLAIALLLLTGGAAAQFSAHAPAVHLPLSARQPLILVQRRQLKPIADADVAAIAAAVKAKTEHSLPAEDAELAEANEASDNNDFMNAHDGYRDLALAGNAAAADLLGTMYFSGRGVDQDKAVAARLFEIAAEAGNPFAQRDISDAYKYGYGVAADDTKAAYWQKLFDENPALAIVEVCTATTLCAGTP